MVYTPLSPWVALLVLGQSFGVANASEVMLKDLNYIAIGILSFRWIYYNPGMHN